MFNCKCFIGGCEARSNIEMRLYKRLCYSLVVCVLTALCLSACSNEDDAPQYWALTLQDANGEYIDNIWTNCDEHTYNLTVYSNIDWILGDTNGVRVSPQSGKRGTTQITISISKNESTRQKVKSFSIRNSEYPSITRVNTYTVYQKGVMHILTNPNKLTLDKDYGKTEVTITSNVEGGGVSFKVESPDWIKVKYLRSEPDDDGDIFTHFYQLQYNDNFGEVRTGKVVFTSPEHNISNYILIIQNGAKGTPYK